MLSEKYNRIFGETLQIFAKNIVATKDNDLIEKQFCLFYPTIGKNFLDNHELLVIGQATRGWSPKFFVNDVQTDYFKLISESKDFSSEVKGTCPLDWVNEKWKELNFGHSFFWNVTYKLVKAHYSRTDKNWNNIIAWSNLMKIAPAYGNPNSSEMEAQVENAAKLFKQELDDLAPKNVLIITNLKTWAGPILEKAKIDFHHVNGEYVEAIGNHSRTKIIVTKRSYIGGRHLPFVEEVSSFLEP